MHSSSTHLYRCLTLAAVALAVWEPLLIPRLVQAQSSDNQKDTVPIDPAELRANLEEGISAHADELYKHLPLLEKKYGAKARLAEKRYAQLSYAFFSAAPLYFGSVESVTQSATDGSTEIVFRMTEQWRTSDRKANSRRGVPGAEKEFDPAQSYDQGTTILWERDTKLKDVNLTFRLLWPSSRPVPLYKGQKEVVIGTNTRDEVTLFHTTTDRYLAARKSASGRVEIVVEEWLDGGGRSRSIANRKKLYLVPDYLDLQISFWGNIVWHKDIGLAIIDGAKTRGDDVAEEEQGLGNKSGWQMANEPSMRVKVGSEGWIAYEQIPLADGLHFEGYIPDDQYMAKFFWKKRALREPAKLSLLSVGDEAASELDPIQRSASTDMMSSESPGERVEPRSLKSLYEQGEAYRTGAGQPVNAAAAFALFTQAAEAGHAASQHRLGVCYALGFGVAQNQTLAVAWYAKAAAQGFAEAQYDLGVRYLVGKGVSKNKSKGMELYREAAAQGYQEAVEALRLRATPKGR